MKPCPDCWVEAQRREATTGEPPEPAYVEALLFCPMLHDVTPMPASGGDPFAARDTAAAAAAG